MGVAVRVGVGDPALRMPMPMRVDQVGFRHQGLVGEEFGGDAVSEDFALFHDEAVVGNVFDQAQVMGGGDHGFAAIAPADEEVYDLALAAGVERSCRFVEQEHFGIEDQHGGESYAFLFAAGKAVRGPGAEVGNLHQIHGFVDTAGDFRLRKAKLEGREGYFVEDGGIEELDIGILEDEADAAAEVEGKVIIFEALLVDRLAVKGDGSGLGELQAVQQPEQGGFTGAVRAEERKAFATFHEEGNAVERGYGFVAPCYGGDLKNRFCHRPHHPAATAIETKKVSQSQSEACVRNSCMMWTSPRKPRDCMARCTSELS